MEPALTRKHFLTLLAAGATPLFAAQEQEIESSSFRVRVRGGPGGVFLSHLSFGGLRDNLLPADPREGILRSGTGLLAEDEGWQFSRLPATGTIAGNRSGVQARGVELGPESAPIARENWEITLAGDSLTWKIEREFLRDARIAADRFPAIVMRTYSRENGQSRYLEIPGFVDPDMEIQDASMFPLHVAEADYFEAVCKKRDQRIRFSPSGLNLESRLSEGFFSFAKAFADGTADTITLGSETVVRGRGAEQRTAGSRQTQVWTLRLDRSASAALSLELPNKLLAEQSRNFAAVHNQWMGWMFGNNPASVPVLQEAAWYPMIQSVYEARDPGIGALDKQLAFFLKSGIEGDGFVMPRWSARGFYRVQWGNLSDQIPHLLLAVYLQALNTGNRDFVSQSMPAIDKITAHLLAFDTDGDGVFEIPNTSGLADGGRHCSNWYDIVNFGHKDALFNAYAVAALEGAAELKAFVGDSRGSAKLREASLRSRDAFNRVFWDEAQGLYMDWIDVREKMPESGRRYFYSDVNMLPIIFGIADTNRAQRIMRHMDSRYASLCQQFHVDRGAIYATPSNLYPVSRLGDLVDYGRLQNQKVYPNYENGCSFFHSTGLEIAARGIAGDKDSAYLTFERVMKNGYAKNRFWAAGLKWDTGELISEPLNNALLILWGFARGCLGVRRTFEGIHVEGDCAAALNGARYTFGHLGKNVTLRVKDGKAVIA